MIERYLGELRARLAGVLPTAEVDRVVDEASAHLEALEGKHLAAGMDADEAARRAVAEFGSVAEVVSGYGPKPRITRLDTAGKWTLGLSIATWIQMAVVNSLNSSEWVQWFIVTGPGRVLVYTIMWAFPLGAVLTAVFARRFPLGRIAIGIAAGLVLTGILSANKFVPNPLGGPMRADDARHSVALAKRVGSAQWRAKKDGGKELVRGRMVEFFAFNGTVWEHTGGMFLPDQPGGGLRETALARMTNEQLREEGCVFIPELEEALQANWVQRTMAALMQLGPYYLGVMVMYASLQFGAWLLGAAVRFLGVWARTRRPRQTVSP